MGLRYYLNDIVDIIGRHLDDLNQCHETRKSQDYDDRSIIHVWTSVDRFERDGINGYHGKCARRIDTELRQKRTGFVDTTR